MKGLFKSKPRTPVDIVRQTRDFLIYVDRTSDVRESKREEKMAELSKNIRELKTILYGNSESEPVSEACAQLTAEFFRENTLRLLITCLPKLNLETRKDATQVVANLQRQQVHSKLIASDYLEANIDLLDILITGYENTDMALHYGAMLRECIRHPSIARYVLESQHMKKFFDYIQLPNFDIAADAAATFKELLTRHKSTVAEFLSKNYDWSLINTVFSALLNQAQYALDLKDQLEAMKTKLEIMEAFISCIVKQRTRGVVIQNILPNLRKIIYEADDILTDCQIRDAYQKYGLWYRFSLGGLFFSYQKGKELKYINSRIEKIVTDLQMYGIEQLIIQGPNNPYQIIKHSSSQDYEPSEIIGLENDLEKIKGWTFGSDEELQQIGIVGMGGLGKTTIAQKIFNDIEIAANFEKRIWVSVSQNFCEERIMRVILKELGEDDLGLEESHLLHKIRQLLSDKSCLIVMDDVWRLNLDWWKKLYRTGKSCFTIVTSRYEDVVMRMGVQKSRIHRPKVLNGDESWSLFRKHAFSTSKGKCPNKEFERKGREILKKCGGLPLAIKTIGALLVPKVHSLNEWNKINDAFHELTVQGENNTVVASLQLSYDELPTHLKQCLLCFSIYPEDVEISGEQIVNWWVGEGLIQGKDNLTAMELGFDCLSELVNRCLVEVVHRRGYDGRVYRCKMHNLVRDMTIKIAKDEAFCSFDEQGRQKLAMDSRWLGFRSDMDPKLLKNCTRVRALLLMSSTAFSFRNVKLLRSLRVLDLLESNDVEDLWDWIHSLTRLAFLNLSCVEVPSSIEKLRNLQILVLRRCARLPISITNLKKLIILDVGSCPLQYLPHGLGKLIYLQELSGFRVVSKSNTQSCRLAELLSLTQLRVLRMSVNNESEISEDEWNVLSQLKKLKVLAIDAEDCKEKNVSWMLEKLLPPPSLQELYLRRYRHETLPKWINPKQLSSLQYLCLEDGDISNFEISSESEGSNVSTWVIEGLCLKFLPNLILDWDVLLKDMPILRYAEVSRCFNLKKFPYPFDKPVIWKKNQD